MIIIVVITKIDCFYPKNSKKINSNKSKKNNKNNKNNKNMKNMNKNKAIE